MPDSTSRIEGGPLAGGGGGGAEPSSDPAPGAAQRGRRPLRAARLALRARTFARGTRASAGIELAIGAIVLVSVAALCFELYSRVEADTAAGRVAATMADYVSRGPDTVGGTLDGKALEHLGAFLHAHELAGADIVFVVSASRVRAGHSHEVLWSDDTLRFGDATATAALAAGCSRAGGIPAAGAVSLSSLDEVQVVVEVCARPGGAGGLIAGDIYRLHVLPVRAPEKGLPAPVHAWRIDGSAGAVARA